MPGKRATSRVERAIMLLTALKPGRMGAERARLLNKEQRCPFVVRDQSDQSDFLRIIPTKRQKSFALSARVPSFERDRPLGGPPLVTPQLNGGPARRAVYKFHFCKFCVGASSTTEIAAGSALSSVEPAGVFPFAPNLRRATSYLRPFPIRRTAATRSRGNPSQARAPGAARSREGCRQ